MKKSKEKTLQKFTDLETVLPSDKITIDHIKQMDKGKLKDLVELFNYKINTLTGLELDEFLQRFDILVSQENKNIIWQRNHTNIIHSVHKLIQKFNRMPNISEISIDVSLSRQTITKHLKEFSTKEIFQSEMDKYHLMLYSLMDKLYIEGVQKRSIKAIRLFFDILTYNTSSLRNSSINQNNYIQINNTKINKVLIDHLPEEAKEEIIRIIKKTASNENLNESNIKQ